MNIAETVVHLFHPRRSNNHRPRLLHPEIIFSLALLAVGFSLFLHSPLLSVSRMGNVLGFASNITASQVIEKTNEERAKLGLSPVVVNSKLNQAALAKGQYMFAKQFWAHTAPDGTEPWKFFKDAGYRYSTAGENLARDFSNSSDMMSAWMASPTHRANIVNPRYRDIGIAVIDGTLLGSETTLVVQLFGTPQTQTAQLPPEVKVQAAQDTAKVTLGAPVPVAQELHLEQTQPVIYTGGQQPAEVLSSTTLPITNLSVPPLFSPLQLTKAFFLAMIVLIVLTLVYDGFIVNHQNTVRLVGKNFAHLLLFVIVAFLLIFFKGGIIQ